MPAMMQECSAVIVCMLCVLVIPPQLIARVEWWLTQEPCGQPTAFLSCEAVLAFLWCLCHRWCGVVLCLSVAVTLSLH